LKNRKAIENKSKENLKMMSLYREGEKVGLYSTLGIHFCIVVFALRDGSLSRRE